MGFVLKNGVDPNLEFGQSRPGPACGTFRDSSAKLLFNAIFIVGTCRL
jgi:hypothetical protein